MTASDRLVRRRRIALGFGCGLVGLASVVSAAPVTLIGGRRVLSRNSPTASHDRTTVRFSTDPALDAFANPTCPSSSSLRIVAGSYDTGEIPLPCQGWGPVSGGYHYSA